MKEAAGEANLTVVAIILIAIVVAVATPLIRSLMRTSVYKSCCTDSGGVWKGGKCVFLQRENFDVEDSYENCQRNAGLDGNIVTADFES